MTDNADWTGQAAVLNAPSPNQTLVGANQLRFIQKVTIAAGTSSVTTLTILPFERALVLFAGDPSSPSTALIVSATDHATSAQYLFDTPVDGTHPFIIYVNPNLGLTVDLTLLNGTANTFDVNVFADTTYPLSYGVSTALRSRAMRQGRTQQAGLAAGTLAIETWPANSTAGPKYNSHAIHRAFLSIAPRGVALAAAVKRATLQLTDGTTLYRILDVITLEGVGTTVSEDFPAPIFPGDGWLDTTLDWTLQLVTADIVGVVNADVTVIVDYSQKDAF